MVVSASQNLSQGMCLLSISCFPGDEVSTLNTLCPDPTPVRPSLRHRADPGERTGEKREREASGYLPIPLRRTPRGGEGLGV